jgi:hypothetical protein
MSDTKPTVPKFDQIDPELVDKISGGDCNLQDYIDALGQLRQGYESIVEFTSYVIERVVTSVNP